MRVQESERGRRSPALWGADPLAGTAPCRTLSEPCEQWLQVRLRPGVCWSKQNVPGWGLLSKQGDCRNLFPGGEGVNCCPDFQVGTQGPSARRLQRTPWASWDPKSPLSGTGSPKVMGRCSSSTRHSQANSVCSPAPCAQHPLPEPTSPQCCSPGHPHLLSGNLWGCALGTCSGVGMWAGLAPVLAHSDAGLSSSSFPRLASGTAGWEGPGDGIRPPTLQRAW